MNYWRQIVLSAVVVLLASCSGKDDRIEGPLVLRAVPGDALAFVYSDNCASALPAVLDSESCFLQMEMGRFAKSPVAFSYHYNGRLSNLMIIELGRRDTPESEDVAAFEANASRVGIMSEFVPAAGKDSRPLMLLSRSMDLIKSSCLHLETGESIVDNDGVQAALHKVGERKSYIMFSNGEYSKLSSLGASPYVKPENLASFLADLTSWTIADIAEDGSIQMETVQDENPAFYMNLLNSDKGTESRLGEILPSDCDFVVSLQLGSVSDWTKARRLYLDAHARLPEYEGRLDDEEDWAKSLNIKELALVKRGESSVLLFRPAKFQNIHSSQDNPYDGYLSFLFGRTFSLADESFSTSCGDWIIWGSEADVNSFIANRGESLPWPAEKTKAVVFQRLNDGTGKILTVCGENSLTYTLSNEQV